MSITILTMYFQVTLHPSKTLKNIYLSQGCCTTNIQKSLTPINLIEVSALLSFTHDCYNAITSCYPF
jgi:hypothetical protein